MRLQLLAICAAGSALAACDDGGVSTQDIQRAAIERAREELGLAGDVPLKATVWTGREADGQLTYCGSVSSQPGATPAIRTLRFAAHGEPLNFFIFGDAYLGKPGVELEKFGSWTALCANAQDA